MYVYERKKLKIRHVNGKLKKKKQNVLVGSYLEYTRRVLVI